MTTEHVIITAEDFQTLCADAARWRNYLGYDWHPPKSTPIVPNPLIVGVWWDPEIVATDG